jgi:lipopolysaccharide transport protein LptA
MNLFSFLAFAGVLSCAGPGAGQVVPRAIANDGGPDARSSESNRVHLEGLDAKVAAPPGAVVPPSLTVASARADWDLKAKKVVFDGNVVASRGPFTLSCDHLEVTYQRADRLEHASATGHVRVSREDLEALGERAILDVDSGRVELLGQPRIHQGSQSLAGNRILLWLDDERLECEGCSLVVEGEAVLPLAPR